MLREVSQEEDKHMVISLNCGTENKWKRKCNVVKGECLNHP